MTREEGIKRTTAFAHADGAMTTCDRCGGRFPGPGVPQNGRTYCCDKCAVGPGAKNMLRACCPPSVY